MAGTESVVAAYRALAAQTGTYVIARQLVAERFGLTVAQVDRIVGSGQ